MVALLFAAHADINVSIPAWSGATLWRVFLHSISAAKTQITALEETAILPQDDSRCIPVLRHDTTMRWHFSDLNNICENLCRDSTTKPLQAGSALPWKDTTLLELMLHHGADPREMDKRMLSALLKQCCAPCRNRYGGLTNNGNESRESITRSHHIDVFDELNEMEFDLELGDEMPDNLGWTQTH